MNKRILMLLFFVFAGLQVNAHVNLVYPVGSEVFNAGEIVNIQWEVVISHNTENWDLFFSGDGGITWNPVELDIVEDSLNYQWVVPDNITSQGQIRIVMDNVGFDYDDNSENFTITTFTAINEVSNGSELKVFPNPMNQNATITFANPANEKHTLIFYNSEGKIIRELVDLTTEHVLFKRNNLASGLYFFHLRTKNKILAKGKIIIE